VGLAWVHNPDWILTGDLDKVFDDVSNGEVTTSGYDGTAGLTGSAPGYLKRRVPLTQPKLFRLGCRFKPSSAPAAQRVLIGVTDENLDVHCSLVLNTDLTVGLWKGAPGDPGASELGRTSVSWAAGSWHRLGLRGSLSPVGAGEMECWRDGTAVKQLSGVATANAAVVVQAGIHIGVCTEVIQSHVYMVDTSTLGHVNLMPSLRVALQRPNAAGNYTEWTGTVPDDIDETTPNDDTDYLTAASLDQRFTAGMTALPAAVYAIYAAQDTVVAKGSGVVIRPVLEVSLAQYTGAWASLTSDYKAKPALWRVNPYTKIPWTRTQLNAAESGSQRGS
jgi:hypothetical protein